MILQPQTTKLFVARTATGEEYRSVCLHRRGEIEDQALQVCGVKVRQQLLGIVVPP